MIPRVVVLAFAALLPAVSSAEVTRVDDILVLNGLYLEFDPIEGLNDTTRDLKWQADYLESFDYTKLPDIDEGEVLQKRSPASECFDCMLTSILALNGAQTRADAYNNCALQCANAAVQLSSIIFNVPYLWTFVVNVWGPYNSQNPNVMQWRETPP